MSGVVGAAKECAVCGNVTTHRCALSFAGVTVAVIPLCIRHGQAVAHGRWALQVEPEWGGPWIDGREYQR
jgi:hypothetical protein